MDEISLEPGFDLRWVRSPDASPAFLASKASCPEPWVRNAVAGHENTAPPTLAAMVPTEVPTPAQDRLVLHLAANPRTPSAALADIARLIRASFDHRFDPLLVDACIALFERADTPDDALAGLLASPTTITDIRVLAAGTSCRPWVRARLASDTHARVRRAAERNTHRPLEAATLAGPGGLVDRAARTRRSTTGTIYPEHVLGPIEDTLDDADDATYVAAIDAIAIDVARSYDDGSLTFWDADHLMNLLRSYMLRRVRPDAEVALAVYGAFDAGEYDHDDGLDPQAAHTDPAIRSILDRHRA